MKPYLLERKMREKFINNMKSSNKIDNYQILIKPVLEKLLTEKAE